MRHTGSASGWLTELATGVYRTDTGFIGEEGENMNEEKAVNSI